MLVANDQRKLAVYVVTIMAYVAETAKKIQWLETYLGEGENIAVTLCIIFGEQASPETAPKGSSTEKAFSKF